MNILNVKDLPASSKLALWWSFMWRGILTTVGSGLLGALLGGLFGVVVAIAGVPRESALGIIQAGGFALGALAGGALFYVYVRWLLSSRLGQFRLLLVRASELPE